MTRLTSLQRLRGSRFHAFTKGRYTGSHICSRTHCSNSCSSVGISRCCANLWSTAVWITAFAIWTLISRTSSTSGSKGLLSSWRAGDSLASAFTAATSISSVNKQLRLSIAPRPIPGKHVELLHSALWCCQSYPFLASFDGMGGYLPISFFTPLCSTGGNGLPVAINAFPSVQVVISLGCASWSRVGLLKGNTMGRSTCFAISLMMSSVKAFGFVDVPIKTCGLTFWMTWNRSVSWLSHSLSSRA